MSRVGKQPIDIPEGVEIKIDKKKVTAKGKLGELSQVVDKELKLELDDGRLTVINPDPANQQMRSKHGLYRNLLNNIISGVSNGFQKTLKIVGVGYRAAKKGEDLEILVGFSNPVVFKKTADVSFEMPDATTIIVKGIDKQKVGQVAADIRKIRKPEPYKGKGIRYLEETVRKKAGKAAITTTA